MSKWKKEKPYEGKIHQGCLICAPVIRKAKMYIRVAVGFGDASITKDGEIIFQETSQMEWQDIPTLMKFENMARKDPDHDWRLILYAPLRGSVYQRHGRNEWVLIESNEGFA